MDTTFRDPAVMSRAIESPLIRTSAYGAIIAGETLTAVAF